MVTLTPHRHAETSQLGQAPGDEGGQRGVTQPEALIMPAAMARTFLVAPAISHPTSVGLV